jgi:hypothetical protein
MITYLDESYAGSTKLKKKQLIIIGALFLPTAASRKHLQKGLLDLKTTAGFTSEQAKHHYKELKYNKLHSPKLLEMAKQAMDLFIQNDQAFFRAGIIEYDKSDLGQMNSRSKTEINFNVKKAMLYTKIVENLIKNTYKSHNSSGGELFMDNLTRCKGDRFDMVIKHNLVDSRHHFLSNFSYIDSRTQAHQPLQICDLLIGIVRNDLFPTRNIFKTQLRKYVKQQLNLPPKEYWKMSHRQGYLDSKHHKFAVKFYKVPYQFEKKEGPQ